MKKNLIIYIGKPKQRYISQIKITKKLKSTLKELDNEKKKTELLEKVETLEPRIILIEAREQEEELFNFLLLIKSHSRTKNTIIIAIFPQKYHAEECSTIYASGVQYGFIADEEEERAINDIGILMDSSKFTPIRYALAQDLSIPTNVIFSGKIAHIVNSQELDVELPLFLEKSSIIEASLNLGNEINFKYFKVIKTNKLYPQSCFPHSARLKILFKGDPNLDSEIVGEMTSQKDFSKFLTNMKKNTPQRDDRFLIIDSRLKTFSGLIQKLNSNNYFIKICNSYLDFEKSLLNFSPQIIYFQIDPIPENAKKDEILKLNSTEALSKLIQRTKLDHNYSPYIFVFNDKSKTHAYRKAYGYKNIVVHEKPFELKYLFLTAVEYQKFYTEQDSSSLIHLKPFDERNLIEIDGEILITDISENQIIFLFKGKLDEFSTFKIGNPLNVHVTIIPSDPPKLGREGYNRYIGLISNSDEKDKKELRKLTNLLIKFEFSKDKAFAIKSVHDLREETLKAKAIELEKMRTRQKIEYERKKKKARRKL
ncbi:MAG: hypothetical protein OXB88_05555 [Bacteriovoracales bacterium]|nr:hypothetical protein [Bacteriovoracales bacterium]